MNRSKKMTVLAASLVLGLGGAALAADTGMGSTGTGMSGMSSGTVDYSLLTKSHLDYTELKQAKARGLSDNEVATVAKISELTGISYRDVVDQVLEGQTFASLASMYNLKLADVLDVEDEKAKIASFEATYETTGKWAMKNTDMSGGMSNSSTMGTTSGASTTGTDTMGTMPSSSTTGTSSSGMNGMTGTGTTGTGMTGAGTDTTGTGAAGTTGTMGTTGTAGTGTTGTAQ